MLFGVSEREVGGVLLRVAVWGICMYTNIVRICMCTCINVCVHIYIYICTCVCRWALKELYTISELLGFVYIKCRICSRDGIHQTIRLPNIRGVQLQEA